MYRFATIKKPVNITNIKIAGDRKSSKSRQL